MMRTVSSKKRLIDTVDTVTKISKKVQPLLRIGGSTRELYDTILGCIAEAPTVDAVEVADKELRKAINLLIKQYEHSKNSDYVHSPVAHAFYYTWKQLDDGWRE
jgi:histone H3/H4